MGEYLSKGTGVTLGTLGTIGFGLSTAQALGGNLLGGILGGGNTQAMMAEIAQLKAEKYSDNSGIELYKQVRSEITDQRDRILGEWVKPLAQEASSNRERLVALEKTVEGNKALADKDLALMRKDIEISTLRMDAKIDTVAGMAKCGLDRMSDAINGLAETVNAWKCKKISAYSICPPVQLRYNAYEVPTNNAPDAQPVTGNINAV